MPLTVNKSYKFWPYITILTGVMISIVSGLYIYKYYDQKEQLELETSTNQIVELVKTRMATYEQVLLSGVGLFNASNNVSRDEWAIFVQNQKMGEKYKGIQGFGYSEVVLPQNKQKHENRIRKEGFADYKIRPDGQREIYTSIIYIEPFDERNKRAFGYDMFSEEVRADAMTKAIQSGETALSGIVRLVQEFDKDIQPGFLMYVPVYKKGYKTDSPQEKTLAIQGFVYAAFRAQDLMQGILGTMLAHIDLDIYDDDITDEEKLLYDSIEENEDFDLFKTVHITINGRPWTITIHAKDLIKSNQSYFILIIPGFILLLTYFLFLVLKTKEDSLIAVKETAQKMQVSEERLRFALEGAGDGLWDWNLKTNEVFYSKRWKEMLGYEEDEVPNAYEGWADKVHPKDLQQALENIKDTLEGKTESYSYEHRLRCKDGAYKWILTRGMIVARDLDGAPSRFVGSHTDISERKAAQIKIEEYLQIIDENVVSSATDLKGIITKVSQAVCDVSGYSKDELLGKSHNIVRHPDMPKAFFEEMWRTIQEGKTWQGDIKNRRKNGETFWVSTTIVPEYDADKNITGYSSIKQNITPQKAKEEFMANMSHELRTPLNAIIGFSGILSKKLKDREFKELSEQINQSSYSLLSLVNDILDLSKIKDSKFTIEAFEFNAYEEMGKLSSQIKGLAAQKISTFNNKTGNTLHGTFMGDWDRISQIILNLISNAVKFTPKSGTIDLDVDYENNSLIISVTDNGIGMNKEVQDRVFRPFEQADGSTTRKYGGTGLGLSITQSLVELMNGKIELQSQEGVGTTFKVTIPLEKVSNRESKEVEASTAEKVPLDAHVLVAEDNEVNQMLITMLLDEFGVSCDIANDGLEAVAIYDPDLHSLILMDENMPNMNGLEAMKIIKEKHQDRCGPIIALTANAMQEDKDKFLKLGMDAYIAKPIDNDELYKVIKELLPSK